MEDIIVYVIVAIVMLVSFFQNYKKEIQKNKERAANQQEKPSTSSPIPPPFSRRSDSSDTETSEDIFRQEVFTNETDTYSDSPYQEVKEYDFTKDEGESIFYSWQNDEVEEKQRQEEVIEETGAFDLQLNTQEDIKRAFVHSLIFERKY
ncbi:MAG: hypothetical protein E6772_05000 [Dysgonomonas sp.]|nr:hypothetical protein [Dysgonomonas sp.]